MALRMREGWEPPYPLVKADFGPAVTRICVALVGVQSCGEAAKLPARSLFDDLNGPERVERAWYTDALNYANWFWIAYWTDEQKFEFVAKRQRNAALVCGSHAANRWRRVLDGDVFHRH